MRKLADKVGITPNVAHNRIENLEKTGVVKGYSLLLDSNQTR